MKLLQKTKRIIKYIQARHVFSLDRNEYKKQFHKENEIFGWKKENEFPILCEKYENAGAVDSHYFLQDIIIASRIISNHPSVHYDVGSRVEGFISHLLAASIEVTMIDVRPFPFEVDKLHFFQGNATDLYNISDNSIESLSSLHAIEHFGLGRYGDPIDKDGWRKALFEYVRILKKGGLLYISVPIGPEDKVMFNAHRIFFPKTIVNTLSGLELKEFSYIKNYRVYKTEIHDYKEQEDYLCGLFVFEKTREI